MHYMADRDTRPATEEEISQVPATCAHFNVRRADRVMTQLYDEMLRPSGLKSTQFTLLTAIRLRGPVTIKGLAEAIVMDRTTLTRNLRPLEKEGWIAILPGTDRRVREVSVTEKGSRALDRAFPLWREAQAHVAERLGKARLSDLLGDLAATVDVVRG